MVPSKAGLVPPKAGFSAVSGLDVGVVPVVLSALKLKPVNGTASGRIRMPRRDKKDETVPSQANKRVVRIKIRSIWGRQKLRSIREHAAVARAKGGQKKPTKNINRK